jgi:hypothetical protein
MPKFKLFAVFVGVMFSSLFRIVRGMKVVAVRYVRVVARLFMIARFMVFCRFSMVVRRLVMMLGCLEMVFRSLMRSHSLISLRHEFVQNEFLQSLTLVTVVG